MQKWVRKTTPLLGTEFVPHLLSPTILCKGPKTGAKKRPQKRGRTFDSFCDLFFATWLAIAAVTDSLRGIFLDVVGPRLESRGDVLQSRGRPI